MEKVHFVNYRIPHWFDPSIWGTLKRSWGACGYPHAIWNIFGKDWQASQIWSWDICAVPWHYRVFTDNSWKPSLSPHLENSPKGNSWPVSCMYHSWGPLIQISGLCELATWVPNVWHLIPDFSSFHGAVQLASATDTCQPCQPQKQFNWLFDS